MTDPELIFSHFHHPISKTIVKISEFKVQPAGLQKGCENLLLYLNIDKLNSEPSWRQYNMIAVKVSFLSLLKDRMGVKELNMDLEDNSTIHDVFSKLFEKFGDDIKTILVKNTGELNDHVVIMLNEKNIRSLDDLNTKIQNKDEITLLPAIAGG